MKGIIAGVLSVLVAWSLAGRADAAPIDAKARSNRAMRLYQLGRYEEAATEFEEAYLETPDPALLFNLGQCYRLSNKRKEALRAFRTFLGLERDPARRAEAEALVKQLERDLVIQSDAAAPPPATPPLTPAPQVVVVPPAAPAPVAPMVDPWLARELRAKRLSICGEDDDDWSFCSSTGKLIGENEFIRRYHAETGSTRLDRYVDYRWRRNRAIAVGVPSLAELALLGGGLGMIFSGGSSSDGKVVGGFALIGISSTALFLTTVIGWPIAMTEPKTRHTMSRAKGEAAVQEYNRAVLAPIGEPR